MLVLGQCQQNKAKLAGLRQVKTGAQRHTIGRAQRPGQHSHKQQLEQHRQQQEHQHQRPVVDDFAPVQHHADADKKQAQQDIVKRTDIRFNLVLEFGL